MTETRHDPLPSYTPDRLARMTADAIAAEIAAHTEQVTLIQSQLTARRPVGKVSHAEYRDWHRKATHAMNCRVVIRTRLKNELTRRHGLAMAANSANRSPKQILIDLVRVLRQFDFADAELLSLIAEAEERMPTIPARDKTFGDQS